MYAIKRTGHGLTICAGCLAKGENAINWDNMLMELHYDGGTTIGNFCSDHPKGEQPHWTEEQIKRANNCPNFALTEDIITGREYKPREYKPREHKPEQASYNQLTF